MRDSFFWRRVVLVLTGALLLALVVPIAVGSTKALAQGSSVTISPTQGAAGTKVTATGSDWTAGDTIQAIWGDTTGPDVGSPVTVNSSGGFTLTFTVPTNAASGSYQVIFWDETSQYFVPANEDFTVSQITVGQTATFKGNGQGTASFIPGQAIKYGVQFTNPGNTSITVNITAKLSGPVTLFYVTGSVTVTPGGPEWYVFSGTISNLAPGPSAAAPSTTYTNEETVVVGGATYVRQSTFTLGDPRLQGAINFMEKNKGSNKYSSPPNPVSLCEQAVENAYGITGVYGSALKDYNAQKAAKRLHSETNPNDSTAPAGALVFFTGSNPADGHVGIAVGNGTEYWTVDAVNGYKGIHIDKLTEGDGYLGWSLAPLSWPGYSGPS